MADTLEINDASMQALASYLQKTIHPATRHEGTGRYMQMRLDIETKDRPLFATIQSLSRKHGKLTACAKTTLSSNSRAVFEQSGKEPKLWSACPAAYCHQVV